MDSTFGRPQSAGSKSRRAASEACAKAQVGLRRPREVHHIAATLWLHDASLTNSARLHQCARSDLQSGIKLRLDTLPNWGFSAFFLTQRITVAASAPKQQFLYLQKAP